MGIFSDKERKPDLAKLGYYCGISDAPEDVFRATHDIFTKSKMLQKMLLAELTLHKLGVKTEGSTTESDLRAIYKEAGMQSENAGKAVDDLKDKIGKVLDEEFGKSRTR